MTGLARAWILASLGHAFRELDRLDEAVDYSQQALDICRDIEFRWGEAAAIYNLGGVYRSQGRFEDSLRCLEQALIVFRETGNRQGESRNLTALGNAYREMRDFRNLEEVVPGEVCTASGTTGNDRLADLGWKPSAERSLLACMRQFVENPNSDRTVSTDMSILQAFAENRKQGKRAAWQDASSIEIGQESYGVGIPNDRPKLCEELNRTITEFINDHWSVEFDRHLKGVQNKDEHLPKATAPCRKTGFL
ncbi:tetratricopeptide repeat protein [Actinophytocola algeriensis]|uniref:tetratricopeptide repeat protein n=1 Tax=Actinophytocola algeriensis TaxID=1768010 RepID=UPI00160D2E54|nr:tetratricopeptide repeat protein [Actinophytocola algeriensis]